MKIVSRAAFLAMPAGTVFSKYEPCVFGELMIKTDTIVIADSASGGDFRYTSVADAIDSYSSSDFSDMLFDAEGNGNSMAMDFDIQSRDAEFEPEQLFAVWERADVAGLIVRLQQSLKAGYDIAGGDA